MKKSILFLSFFQLLSCSGRLPSLFARQEGAPTNKGEISIESIEPKIYLSQENQLIPLRTLNRENIILNLSDKIIFSNQEANKPILHFKNLKDFKEKDENLKIKVSSFCAYKKNQPKNADLNRSFQEKGSPFYRWSFSIFELIPQEILLHDLEQTFSCSFIFAFKDSEGVFNHYNIAQQPIALNFSSERVNKLSLVRETEDGPYLHLGDELVESKNIPKILILNETKIPATNYQLFCEGLQIADFNFDLDGQNIFARLMAYDLKNLPEGIKKCRIFSKNKHAFTGMTDSFLLDFDSLKNKRPAANLKIVADPILVVDGFNPKYEDDGSGIPLNSHFHFDSLNMENRSHSIDIKINTQCVGANAGNTNELLSETYSLPFRRKIPLMAVTPKQIFFMEIKTSSYRQWLKFLEKYKKQKYSKQKVRRLLTEKQSYKNNCIYKISLQDRKNQTNKKDFRPKAYLIKWTEKAYGIDEIVFNIYARSTRFFESVEDLPSASRAGSGFAGEFEKIKKPFFSLTEDIDTNKMDYLKLNFFDAMDDSFLQIEGAGLDKMALSCFSKRQKASITAQWPYNLQANSISLKTLFLNPNLRRYIQNAKIGICRLFFYEKDILRYFSEEMRITY